MNYMVLTDSKMFNTQVAVFDSNNFISLGLLLKHGVINRMHSLLNKDNEKFQVIILKIKSKHMDKFKEAMADLDNINRALFGQEYIDYCSNMNKMLHYERYKVENN